MTLNFIDLFAGIGGNSLGLERAGMRCVAQVEKDPWALRVLAKHWPDVPKIGDVRDAGSHNLPAADLIAGGFPCQDISYAGRGVGITGSRSGLWTEYARIIGEIRPRYVFVENVPALLRRGIDVVLGDLAALGYDAEWDCVPASAIGAPHRRDRVWIVAYANGQRLEERGIHDLGREEVSDAPSGRRSGSEPVADSEGDGCRSWRTGRSHSGGSGQLQSPLQVVADPESFTRDAASASEAREHQGRGTFASRGRCRADRDWPHERWAAEPRVARVAHGLSDGVDRIRGLGNSVVPQVVEAIGRRIVAWEEANANY